jgi:hypothetical protein
MRIDALARPVALLSAQLTRIKIGSERLPKSFDAGLLYGCRITQGTQLGQAGSALPGQ